MNNAQKAQINEVRNKIKEIRDIIDNVMYNRAYPELHDNEYTKLLESSDLICQANDKLP
jgi:hypothetical protein